ncbi:MAG: thioredoxin family protein [Hyphomicrobium sp.]
MLRIPAIVLSLFLLAAPWTANARAPDLADVWNGAEIKWRDIRSGIYESSKSGKPVVMVFHASWCTACKKYRAVFFDKGIVEASKDFVMILIDGDADKASNGAFAPDGTYVPRTIFLDAEGNIQSQLKGAGDPQYPHSIDINGPAELLALMQRARETIKDAPPPQQSAGDKT